MQAIAPGATQDNTRQRNSIDEPGNMIAQDSSGQPPAPRLLCAWRDEEIEAAIERLSQFLDELLAMDATQMTETELQCYEQLLDEGFDRRETLQIEQLTRDVEVLVTRFPTIPFSKAGQPRIAAPESLPLQSEGDGQPRTAALELLPGHTGDRGQLRTAAPEPLSPPTQSTGQPRTAEPERLSGQTESIGQLRTAQDSPNFTKNL